MVLATMEPNERWLWVTPFGLPVLPEVKKMTATASGVGGVNSIAGGSVCRNASKLGARPSVAASEIRPSGSLSANLLWARSASRSA